MANKPGRPTAYRAEMDEQAYKLCLLGLTNEELAQFFEVCERTIDTWIAEKPSFSARVRAGKDLADADVAASLNHRARGYSHDAEKIMVVGGEVVREAYTEHYPPDTAAAIFWLKNRQRSRWKDKIDTEHTGPGGTPLMPPTLTVMLVPPKSDGDA